MILFDETIRQSADDGTPFPELLDATGHHPRHQGRQRREAARARARRDGHRGPRRPARAARGVPRARRPLRQVARGDHDRRRHAERDCVWTNAHALARYAALCQEAGLVPIVEPEVLMDGDAHDRALRTASPRALARGLHRAAATSASTLEGTLLKPNMVLSGNDCADAGRRRRGRRARRCAACAARAGGGARHRLPLRRPVRRGRDRAPRTR